MERNQIATNKVLRLSGNLGLLIGQGILLYISVPIGITIKIFSAITVAYSLRKYKMWDVMAVLTAFSVLDLSKLIHILFL